MSDRAFRLAGCLVVAALVVITASVSLKNGFLNYDDPQMIVANPRLRDPGAADVALVFTETREFAWLPVSFLALMPDAALFGGDPAGYHLGSLLWHVLSSALLFAFLHALARSRTVALVAASVFAAHPMAAESVAWASGRKDQVSFVLLILALAAALGHLRRGGAGRLALSLACAAVALLAKGSAVVYPLLAGLVLLFARADGTLSPRARPAWLLVLGVLVAGGAAALHLAIALGEGTASLSGGPGAWQRFVAFLEAVARYAGHAVVPVGLSIHYDVRGDRGLLVGAGALVLAAGIAGAVRLASIRRPGAGTLLAFSAAWFVAALLPFNGVVPRTSVAMADRYAFDALPAVGIAFGVLVAALPAWLGIAAAAGALLALVPLSRARYAEFADGETVFRAALRVDPGDSLAPLKLGEALRDKPPLSVNRAEAIALMRSAVARAPDPVREARARLVLADTLLQDLKFAESVAESDRLLALEETHGPDLRALGFDSSAVRYNRAAALLGAGRRADALASLDEVLRTDPGHRPARLLRAGLEAQEAFGALASASAGVARDRERERVNRSLQTYEKVVAELVADQRPDGVLADQEVQACADLVRLLKAADWRPDYLNAAIMHAEALVRRHPGRAEGYLVRAQVVQDVDPAAAVADLREAAARNPRSPSVRRALSSALLALGRNREAIAMLEEARKRDPGDPAPVSDLRAIYVGAGRSHLEDPQKGPDPKRARQALELAQELGRDDPSVLDLEASILEADGRSDEAAKAWEKLHAIDPANEKARMGVARLSQRRGLAIISNLKVLTESYPADHRGARREELLAAAAGEFTKAVTNAGASDEVDFARSWLKSQAEASEVEGHAAMGRGDDAAALKSFERTLALDGDNLAANDALARLYLKRGDRGPALSRARKFLALAARLPANAMLAEEIALMERIVKTLEETAPETRK
jgi:tetratricopeptide (TPR) repeat protein